MPCIYRVMKVVHTKTRRVTKRREDKREEEETEGENERKEWKAGGGGKEPYTPSLPSLPLVHIIG